MQNIVRERDLGSLLAFLGVSFGAAALGGLLTARSVGSWYQTLRRPRWNPPDWVFGPVWTVLYVMMAITAWLVRRAGQEDPAKARGAQMALAAWSTQLALNVTWSGVFFGQRDIRGGLGVIVALWGWIAATAALASRVSPLAGVLLLPYLAWTSFASVLNYRIWKLNQR